MPWSRRPYQICNGFLLFPSKVDKVRQILWALRMTIVTWEKQEKNAIE